MVKGITESGFEFELDEEILDDYELLESLCDIDNGDASNFPAVRNHLKFLHLIRIQIHYQLFL